MGTRRAIVIGLAVGLLLPALALAADDVVMKAMQDEMQRSMKELRLEGLDRPYFLSFQVDESTVTHASASFGSLLSSGVDLRRWLTVEVRVGSYDLDNTNFLSLPGFSGAMRTFGGRAALPLEDDYQEIRRQIWLATDGAYKEALENLSKKRAALQNRTRTEELADFSREEPFTATDDSAPVEVDKGAAEKMVRDLSALFREMPDIFTSEVELGARTARTRFLNSEGSSFTRVAHSVGLVARAATQAEDGLPLQDFVSAYGSRMEDLPAEEELAASIREMGARLARLRSAPLLERYNGPVLFEGQAAAELFAQIFAPGLLASRKPVVDDPRMAAMFSQGGQSLEDKLGARVLPRFLKVVDDPTLSTHGDDVLVGGYAVDDQGVPASATSLIERGMLKTLLTDRTPITGVDRSTGNHRGGGVLPSNLVVSADGGMSAGELKEELLALVGERQAEFGVLVRRLGNPQLKSETDRMMNLIMMGPSGRDGPRAEAVIEAYRVYPDGREELIRNVEIAGISAATFKEIVAASESSRAYTAPFAGGGARGPMIFLSMGPGGGGSRTLVSWVVPSLLFEDLTLKKPGGEIPNPPVADHPYFDPTKGR
jgi:hypothetical protein